MVKKALIVDDSNTMRNMVSLTLKDIDFDVVQAEDGQHALDIIGDTEFDVVITDVNMPNMNGIELIAELRKKPKFKYTPILVLTTEGGDDMKKEGKAAGATGWLVKPFNPETLLNVIGKVCVS